MSDPIELSVKSSLSSIVAELQAIKTKADEVAKSIRASSQDAGSQITNMAALSDDAFDAYLKGGEAVGDSFRSNVKKTEGFFSSLRGLSRRIADQMRGDFRSLLSVNALTEGLKLSNQFKENISETIELSNTVRKLGSTFGIAQKDFASFQAKITDGLGDIGMSSDVAAATLEGLSQTPVRGTQNILTYSQQAGMLASISQEKGKEGDISRSMANVIQARGGNVNDRNEVRALAEDLRKIFNQTGQVPTASMRAMEDIFRSMPKDLRESISPTALTNLAAAGAVGGPNATKFLEEYLGKSPIARMAFDAQGGRGIMTDDGIDVDKFSSFAKGIMGRIGGDPRLAAQTLGLSEDAAEGFVRLAENLDKVRNAQDKIAASTGSLNEQYRSSMGLGEAFKANINKVKQALSGPMSAVTQGTTDALSGAAESNVGAAAVVGGGALLAGALAGAGLKGIGKGLGGIAGGLVGTVARKEGAESVLGQNTVPVYVVNASEIGGLGSMLPAIGGAGAGAGAAAGAGALTSLLGPIAIGAGALMFGKHIFGKFDEAIENAGKDTTSTIYTKGQLEIFKKMYEADRIPERQKDNVRQILEDNGMIAPPRRIAVPGAAGAEAAATVRQPTPTSVTGASMQQPVSPSAAGEQRVRVIIENKTGFKASSQPARGAPN